MAAASAELEGAQTVPVLHMFSVEKGREFSFTEPRGSN